MNHIAKNCSLAKNLSPKKIFQCFKCGNEGHIASKCLKVAGKQVRGICVNSLRNNNGISALSIIQLKVNGMVATAIVDTGCSQTILNQNFLSKNQRKCLNSPKVVTFEGNVHQCIGLEIMTLEVDGIKVCDEVILVDFRPFGVDMMLGMKSIRLLGGVCISSLGKVKFGSSS